MQETLKIPECADNSTDTKRNLQKVKFQVRDMRHTVFFKIGPLNVAVLSDQYVAVISNKYVVVISNMFVAVISNKYVVVISDKYVVVITNRRRPKDIIFSARQFLTISEPKYQILRPMSFQYFSQFQM